MNIRIKPLEISGEILVPPSKSLTHRACILGALSNGTSIISNPLMSDDTRNTLNALKALGVKIEINNSQVIIEGCKGKLHPIQNMINLGESGTSARLFIGLSTLCDTPIIIDGSDRLKERPNEDLFKALEIQGLSIEYLDKLYHLPVKIIGKRLIGGTIKISGKISSQFISSLLLIAPFAKSNTTIEIVDELKSTPYVDLTIDSMKQFGVQTKNNNYKSFVINGNQKYQKQEIMIEGDYSSASYPIVLSFLSGKPIKIHNCDPKSHQADAAIIGMIEKLGGICSFENKILTVTRNLQINSAEFNISQCPDIALSVGIIGPFTDNKLVLTGIKNLAVKESDRAEALISNLKKLGANIESDADSITIYRSKLKTGDINTFNDHRVAMSFSILATQIQGGLIIKNSGVVSKSYPDFYDDMKKLGISIRKI